MVEFFELNRSIEKLRYVVIGARYKGKWIYARHKDRLTWEIPGGHIEKNEDVDNAARRELREETGALDFQLLPISNCTICIDDMRSYLRLYLAQVNMLGNLKFEIEEIKMMDGLPNELTYPKTQPYFYQELIKYIKSS